MLTSHRTDTATERDRAQADRLPRALEAVDRATHALAAARRGECCDGPSQALVRSRCQELRTALDAAVESAAAAVRVATGPLDGLPRTRVIALRRGPRAREAQRVLDELRTTRQRHLLSAGPACGAQHHDGGQAFAAHAVGAVWPVSDYLPEKRIYRTKSLLPPVDRF